MDEIHKDRINNLIGKEICGSTVIPVTEEKLKLSFLHMVNATKFQENCKTNLYLLENIIVQSVTNLGYHSKNFMFGDARELYILYHLKQVLPI